MRALVAFATEHGSTREIAERIAEVLATRGLSVDVLPADAVSAVGDYDAVVIGSAVHSQQWLPPALELVRRCAAAEPARRVWLFSVGMPGALRPPLKRWAYTEEPKLTSQFEGLLRPEAHRLFSGVIAPGQLSPTGRLAVRAIGARYGDFREWPEIEAYAAAIADAVSAGG